MGHFLENFYKTLPYLKDFVYSVVKARQVLTMYMALP